MKKIFSLHRFSIIRILRALSEFSFYLNCTSFEANKHKLSFQIKDSIPIRELVGVVS